MKQYFALRRMSGVTSRKLKGIQDLFTLLCQSADELNSLFSIPILFFLTSTIITTSIELFFVIYWHFVSDCIVSGSDFELKIMAFIWSGIIVGVLLKSAHSPVQEVLVFVFVCLSRQTFTALHQQSFCWLGYRATQRNYGHTNRTCQYWRG